MPLSIQPIKMRKKNHSHLILPALLHEQQSDDLPFQTPMQQKEEDRLNNMAFGSSSPADNKSH